MPCTVLVHRISHTRNVRVQLPIYPIDIYYARMMSISRQQPAHIEISVSCHSIHLDTETNILMVGDNATIYTNDGGTTWVQMIISHTRHSMWV